MKTEFRARQVDPNANCGTRCHPRSRAVVEQDRVLLYFEQIMDIAGIQSSDGMLNDWRYGFDPTKVP